MLNILGISGKSFRIEIKSTSEISAQTAFPDTSDRFTHCRVARASVLKTDLTDLMEGA
jgi:hypothetical protein